MRYRVMGDVRAAVVDAADAVTSSSASIAGTFRVVGWTFVGAVCVVAAVVLWRWKP